MCAPFMKDLNSLTYTFNYQIGRLRIVCESGGEFLGRFVLCTNDSEFTHLIMIVPSLSYF